jgi:hypothetical protein
MITGAGSETGSKMFEGVRHVLRSCPIYEARSASGFAFFDEG